MSRELHMAERDEDVQEEGASRLAWFLTGAIIGATVAILYAPKSGKQTRDYLGEQAQRGRDAMNETSQDVVKAGREMFERGRKLVEDAAELFERGRKLVRG